MLEGKVEKLYDLMEPSPHLLKPEFPHDTFKTIAEDLGIPLGVYRRVPDFLVQKFENLKMEL